MQDEIISNVLLTIEQHKGDLTSLKNSVLDDNHFGTKKHFSRLLIWKTCFITETLNIRKWQSSLQATRVIYHKLRKNTQLAIPWHSLEKDNEFWTSKAKLHTQSLRRFKNVQSDPLSPSQNNSSPFSEACECDDNAELLQSIVLDVQRLFPGDEFFHHNVNSLKIKRLLITLIYTWSKCNSNVGYKQGIHEIFGLVYRNFYLESVTVDGDQYSREDMDILSLYNLHYLEHDTFSMLNKFLVSSGIIKCFYESEALLLLSIQTFNGYLMKVDQLIHYNLITKLKLESQLWIIRFLRLLLLRELGTDLDKVSLLWDKMAAAESMKVSGTQDLLPDLVSFLVVALLIHIKSELILCDFSGALSLLLHYPIAGQIKEDPNFISNLFKDAMQLNSLKGQDLKLYEFGNKLNQKYNLRIKVILNHTGSSPKSSIEKNSDDRKVKMAFEKYRTEMRLKKKAQSMINLE